MKTLKLDHEAAQRIMQGSTTSTWRLFDDKDLSVNDQVRLIDKVDPNRPETWQVIGTGVINQIVEKRMSELKNMNTNIMYENVLHKNILTTAHEYYGNNVNDTTIIKILEFSYTPVKQSDDVATTTLPIKKVNIFADGGSRGNPGPSAGGFVITDPDTARVLVDKNIYLGVTTNNQAEYLALKYALEEALKMGVREASVFLDSMLVINQMNGTFKIRNRDLWPIHESIKNIIKSFKHVTFTHVPREMNKLADAAVNRALDEHAEQTEATQRD